MADLLTRFLCICNTQRHCGPAACILHMSMHRLTPCTHTHTCSRHTPIQPKALRAKAQYIPKQASLAQPAVRSQLRRAPASPSTPCIPLSPPSFRLFLSVSLPSFCVAGAARPERTEATPWQPPCACARVCAPCVIRRPSCCVLRRPAMCARLVGPHTPD